MIAIIMAIVLDIIIARLLGHSTLQAQDLIRASLIPLVIAPFISWYLVGLLIELNKMEKNMTSLATYDDLTGLFNRRVFYQSCEKNHSYSIRTKTPYCLLIIDLDGFKKINDKYGHACGDQVLSTFAKLSLETIRVSDILARIGGEEFALFLPNTNTEEALVLAERLCTRIRKKPVISANKYIQYTISVGVAINQCKKEETMESVLKKADDALYQAKDKGGNQVIIYNE